MNTEGLREALAALIAKLDAVAPHLTTLHAMAQNRGMRYTGPTYGAELEAARRALEDQPAPLTDEQIMVESENFDFDDAEDVVSFGRRIRALNGHPTERAGESPEAADGGLRNALRCLECASQFAANRGLAVEREWVRGWDACIDYVHAVLAGNSETQRSSHTAGSDETKVSK